MQVSRWWYGIAAAVTVGCGLASRQWSAIPAWAGDLLWATLVFFLLSVPAPGLGRGLRAIAALAFSWLVEFSQLYHVGWLDRVRGTTVGHLVLGQGFSWGDLLAYAAGIALALAVDAALPVGAGSSGGQPAGNRVRDR